MARYVFRFLALIRLRFLGKLRETATAAADTFWRKEGLDVGMSQPFQAQGFCPLCSCTAGPGMPTVPPLGACVLHGCFMRFLGMTRLRFLGKIRFSFSWQVTFAFSWHDTFGAGL